MDSRIYTPLTQQPGAFQIRLLRLLPDPDLNTPIHCSLLTLMLTDLDERPHLYEALSYVWGDPNDVVEILVSGLSVKVTTNLHAALWRLRNHHFERLLWIDALCIDQENPDEVATQILSMSRIYGQANRVLVWLGEAAHNSDTVLDSLRTGDLGDVHQDVCALQEDICRLLERPWFRRIWVLQEVAAAQHIRIICGPKEVDGYNFSAGIEKLSYHLAHQPPVIGLIKRATFRAPYMSKNSGRASLDVTRLVELVDLYHNYEASKRHDKVYALLGMSTDNLDGAGLSPDYAIPWDELMRRVIRHVLRAEVRIRTWQDRELAMIIGRGCILGTATRVCQIRFDISRVDWEDIKNNNHSHTMSSLLKPVQMNDIFCHLEGTPGITVIRQCKDYFQIIALSRFLSPDLTTMWTEEVATAEVHWDLPLLWNWEMPTQISPNQRDKTLVDVLKTGCAGHIVEAPKTEFTRLLSMLAVLRILDDYNADILDRMQEIMNDHDVMLWLDDSQVLQLAEELLIACATICRTQDVQFIVSKTNEMKGHFKKGDWCNMLVNMDPNIRLKEKELKVRQLSWILGKRCYRVTASLIARMAAESDQQLVLFFLLERRDEFGFAQVLLFVIFAQHSFRPRDNDRIRQLLLQTDEEDSLLTERILRLTAAAYSGVAAIVRIVLRELTLGTDARPRIFLDVVNSCVYRILPRLSQQEFRVRVTEEVRSAAAGSPVRATENLIHMLQTKDPEVTGQMLKTAARFCDEKTMYFLLKRIGGRFRITKAMLAAARGNLLPYPEVAQYLEIQRNLFQQQGSDCILDPRSDLYAREVLSQKMAKAKEKGGRSRGTIIGRINGQSR